MKTTIKINSRNVKATVSGLDVRFNSKAAFRKFVRQNAEMAIRMMDACNSGGCEIDRVKFFA